MSSNSRIRDYYELLKPGVISLIVFSTLSGFFLADGEKNIFLMAITLLAITLASSGSAALNMWYDSDIDKIMKRTAKRPIPIGNVDASDAMAFGIILCIFSLILNLLSSNILSTILLFIAIIFYVFIYTMWLKRRTPQNIVIGGAAGAFPPLISYVSITGYIDLQSIMLFLIIFLWTPPHFWALALYRNDDYKKANIPMLPVIKGVKYSLYNIVFYTLILVVCSFALYFVSPKLGYIYLYGCILANIIYLFYTWKLCINTNAKTSIKTFLISILYLFLLFAVIIIDALI
jgi:protoheme IX farnesyltransferase